LDFRQLFKLRLVVAAMGETQRLVWWNSGVLTGTGEFLFQQGFPRSAPFAQTRAGFRYSRYTLPVFTPAGAAFRSACRKPCSL
jgi:hypothetical protein